MLRGLAEQSRSVLRKTRRAMQTSIVNYGSMIFLLGIGLAIAMSIGVFLFSQHTISMGTVYLIFAYTTLMNKPIELISQQLRELQETAGSVTRVLTLLSETRTIEDGNSGHLPGGAISVTFEDVSFSYTQDVPVLQNIALHLQPGNVLGLLGRTGSGKTTMTKLLTRLYDPTQGSIKLSDQDLRTLTLDDLRGHIGIVSQEVNVLHATVRDNLTLFDPTILDPEISQALNEVGLGDWLQALPEGLDTRLAPGGSGLSAGEAQLLAFARIFLKKECGLVILDEASARLDPATERLLERAIDRLLAGRTAIIIAHRLTTVQRADTIMILEDGHCCELGQRRALASDDDSRYARLLRTGLEEVLA
jgi:ABC-type multidrug transport system fused ATPase/permease subunit